MQVATIFQTEETLSSQNIRSTRPVSLERRRVQVMIHWMKLKKYFVNPTVDVSSLTEYTQMYIKAVC